MNARKILAAEHRPVRRHKAPWLTAQQPGGPIYRALSDMVREESLHTVRQEAACPNVGECWERARRPSC